MTKERPIIFNAEMVKAILAKRKTQMRRVIKPQPTEPDMKLIRWVDSTGKKSVKGKVSWAANNGITIDKSFIQPFFIGDRLWVRESFWGCDMEGYGDQAFIVYDNEWHKNESGKQDYYPATLRPCARFGRIPSVHMPRDASRITLEITGVSVERLQDISRGDAMAEGCPFPNMADGDNPKDWYRDLWESINGKGSWKLNPWVWVVKFKILEVKL